jgi:hypothetical protein
MSSRSIQSSCLESTSPIDFSSTHFRNSQPTIHYSSPRISKANAIAVDRELKQYSFDRAVICDDAEIARCLIANNFHFENNSAVLSVDGYPHDIFATVMDMLRLNPELQVYAVHDASRRGVALPHILSTEPRWFAGTTVKIFDVGLLPRQIFNRPVVVEKKSCT